MTLDRDNAPNIQTGTCIAQMASWEVAPPINAEGSKSPPPTSDSAAFSSGLCLGSACSSASRLNSEGANWPRGRPEWSTSSGEGRKEVLWAAGDSTCALLSMCQQQQQMKLFYEELHLAGIHDGGESSL